jgi:hypothetical protein
MRKTVRPFRVTGTLEEDGTIRPDKRVPLPPGRVEVSVAPIGRRTKRETRSLDILDLAGSAREVLRGVDVDEWLRQLRDEWDRKVE